MNYQEEKWSSDFGEEYTNRNPQNNKDANSLCLKNFGIPRDTLNNRFIGNLDKNINILEVGSNCGAQLDILQKMGFKNLWGIDISPYALRLAKKNFPDFNLVLSSATDIPFKDSYFDLVFTIGVLIHLSNENLTPVINEMYRVSKKFIWGFEYFSEKRVNILYRGQENLLWKDNFMERFLDNHNDLKVVKEEKLEYTEKKLIDQMYLLQKR